MRVWVYNFLWTNSDESYTPMLYKTIGWWKEETKNGRVNRFLLYGRAGVKKNGEFNMMWDSPHFLPNFLRRAISKRIIFHHITPMCWLLELAVVATVMVGDLYSGEGTWLSEVVIMDVGLNVYTNSWWSTSYYTHSLLHGKYTTLNIR